MHADFVRQRIRQRLGDGRLPHGSSTELGHGRGVGQVCDACGEPITPEQQLTVRISSADRRTLRRTSSPPKRTRPMSSARFEELRGIHVLVIDDDPLTRHYLRSVLEFSGAIVTATAAAGALRAALIADVIACDLESAQRAGSGFLAQLQQLHVHLGRAVPTIALVAPGMRGARVRAEGFGMYLIKPVDSDDLRAAVVEASRQ
jgi:CheY-like chemotaxis protein